MINGKKTFPTVWSFLRPVDLWGTIFLILQTCFCTMFSETFRDHLIRLKLCREYAISTIFLHSSWELNISCLCKRTLHLHTVREEFVFHNMLHCIPNNSLIQGVQFNCSPPKFSKGSHPTKKYVTVWILSKGPWPPPPPCICGRFRGTF